MHQTNNFSGQSGFYHAFGIVEDRIDPDRLGRLKVRWFGIHTEDKAQLSTGDLPWAQVILPINSAPNSVPNVWEGDMVFGFFADGLECQIPVVVGTVSSNKGGGNPLEGFSDPRDAATVSLPGGPNSSYSKREQAPGPNPMASGINYYTSHVGKAKEFVDGIKGPGGSVHNEPFNPYAPTYPYNHAEMSESGHLIEIDDSPESERVHIFHRKGSFVEFHPDGSLVVKSVKNDSRIVIGESLSYTGGSKIESIEGSLGVRTGNYYAIEVASSDMLVEVLSGNMTITVNGNVTQTVTGNVTQTIGGSSTTTAVGPVAVTSAAAINLTAPKVNING